MKNNQALILSSNSFKGRDAKIVNGEEVFPVFNSLLVAKPDRSGKLTVSTLYVDDDVYTAFIGVGVYDCTFDVYFDNKGNAKTKLSQIVFAKKVEL